MGWEGVQPPSEPAGYDPNNKFGEQRVLAPAQCRGGSPTAPSARPARLCGVPMGRGSATFARAPRVGRRCRASLRRRAAAAAAVS